MAHYQGQNFSGASLSAPTAISNMPKISKFIKLGLVAFTLIVSSFANAEVAPLTVNGSQIRVGGEVKALAGNSYFWSNTGWGQEKYYNADSVKWLKSDWKSNIVRAAMGVEEGGAYLQDRARNVARTKAIVDAAIAEDMYVIIDWHSHHAEDYREEAIEFFTEMAQTYGQYDNVIYEIYNEPLQISWSDTIKPYAEAVIGAIRAVDPDNLIIVGTPTWSQEVDQAAADPITGFDNIAYTLHFYAGTHKQWLRDRAEQAMNAGIAIMVTEWGSVNANGDGAVDTAETQAWVDWMQQHNISHLNWSVSDKNEGASMLRPGASPTGNWAVSDLTTSGQLVRNIIREQNSDADTGGDGDGDGDSDSDGGDGDGDGDSGVSASPCSRAAAVSLPGTVQAESHCDHEGIRTQNTSDTGGGDNIGWIENGDWSEYQVNVTEAGIYQVEARVASARVGGTIDILSDNRKIGSIPVISTGGWQSWQTNATTVELEKGSQTIRLNFSGGASSLLNVNWIDFSKEVDNDDGNTDGGARPDGVSCEFLIVHEWNTGFVAEVKITNTSGSPVSGNWSVGFQFADGSSVSSGWNGTFSGSAPNPVSISPLSWNNVVASGSSVSFGVQGIKGSRSSAAPTPEVTGSICQ